MAGLGFYEFLESASTTEKRQAVFTLQDFVEQIQGIITVGDFYDMAAGGQIIFT